MAQIEAGAAKIDITHPVGTELCGYTPRVEGTNRSTGIHDPLWTRCLALRYGERSVLVLVMDLLGIELDVTHRIRSLVAQRLPVDPDSILVCCTHNHCGPSLLRRHETHILVDENWKEQCIAASVDAAVNAFRSAQPASLSVGRTEVSGVGANRKAWLDDGTIFHFMGLGGRVPPGGRTVVRDGIVDPELSVLCARDPAGKMIAILINYACHPWIYNSNRISSEISGACASMVEDQLARDNPGVVSLFTPGTGSNITTIQNQVPIPASLPDRERWFTAERTRLGGVLARAAVAAAGSAAGVRGIDSLNSQICPLDMPVYDRVLAEVIAAHHGLPDTRESMASELQVITAGPVALVGLPSEVYVEYGLTIKARSRYPHTFVLSQSNDYFADLITAQAAEEGVCPELQWTRVHPAVYGEVMGRLAGPLF